MKHALCATIYIIRIHLISKCNIDVASRRRHLNKNNSSNTNIIVARTGIQWQLLHKQHDKIFQLGLASYILSSLLLGAQVMISSTRRIISAASVAESNTACLTLNASDIPKAAISPTCNCKTPTIRYKIKLPKIFNYYQ